MMLPRASADQYRIQQGISTTTASAVSKLWRRMGDDFDESWESIGPKITGVVEAGRKAAVAQALPYTSLVLQETNQVDTPVGELDPNVFLSTAPDGRDLVSLYDESIVKAKTAVATGETADAALGQAGRWLTMVTLTTLADTRREVYSADIAQRPTVTGYTRMLNPPSCGRCTILAGKWFRWNEGFQRHPRCDCQHIPASENVAGDLRTDPYKYFESLSKEEQEAVFGRSQARAVREGADIYRVVNFNGKRGLPTAASARRSGITRRMTIDDILRTAGTRTNAIRMMREAGYIRDRGQVAIARSPGVLSDAQIIAAGRGRGLYTLGGQTLTTNRAARFDAVSTGERDILRRSTMTAAERRLYDAHYRLQYALTNGSVPRSIGRSSADLYANAIPATPARIEELREALRRQISSLNDPRTPDSVRRLAAALGLV
ncbi:hypothetical protein GCM10010910_01270 [Microbacterium nanhaiense]|uniref:Phage head morphogenesis domain-containing protein n=1 Tax=Microbacterium nanhaiense TaxID=1301026 RepID=A0ABQ2MUZ1_9MICO|nr:hypothetical protein [Microbacterium nanhaiense]GGO59101.1 hypothetical protein GCM10010910_01270 [Microbacterium nanhaiense]